MLFNVMLCILVLYVCVTPYFYAKAVKFGVKMATKPEETAKEPVFNVKTPKKALKRTPEQDRITKILQNIDRYNGTSNGQVKVEVDR
ncbi:MAG: hypothetical protein ACOCPA_07935 [Segatella copri]